MMGICMRYLRNEEEAADAFQEAFIKIFRSIGQVREEKALPGWIRRISINTAVDHLKAIKYNRPIGEDGEEFSDDFYNGLLDKMSSESILEEIDKLPEGYRVVFNLYIVDGYSHKEIADRLQISESTSRSQLTFARRLLKKQLNEMGITRYEKVI